MHDPVYLEIAIKDIHTMINLKKKLQSLFKYKNCYIS